MTKKEQAQMDALKQEVRLAKALRFTEPVSRDVPAPTGGDKLTTGWDYAGALGSSPRVDVACSGYVSHAFGRTDKTTSQHSRALFSSRLLALRALRYEVEIVCAKQLAAIDAQIEAEQVTTK